LGCFSNSQALYPEDAPFSDDPTMKHKTAALPFLGFRNCEHDTLLSLANISGLSGVLVQAITEARNRKKILKKIQFPSRLLQRKLVRERDGFWLKISSEQELNKAMRKWIGLTA
jgi:hypothetical protein